MKRKRKTSLAIDIAFPFSRESLFFTRCANLDRCAWISTRCEVLHCRIFIEILTAMSNDWQEYSNMYTMMDKAILAHRYSKFTIGVYSMAVLLYSTASLNFRKQTDDCRELLIKMELPFAFCDSPIYEVVMCMQFVHLMAVASAIGMLDALLVTLVSCDR